LISQRITPIFIYLLIEKIIVLFDVKIINTS
jgi:hypothetical protein